MLHKVVGIKKLLKNFIYEPILFKQDVVGLDISEIEKAVGSLTCMSLRFRPMGMLRQSGQTTKKNGFTTLAPSQTSLSNGYKDVKVVLNGSPETNPKIKGF